MTKRKRHKKQDRTHLIIKYLSIVAIVLLILAITGVTGYYFGFDAGKKQMAFEYNLERQKMLLELKEATKVKPKLSRKERLNTLLEKHKAVSASHEYEKKP
ncbi:MAG: hypothetical protein U9R50_10980, partial [Campylobacterota bacterium]|nr:hypothetical protein [Campylobacterota bacterium]